MGANVPRERGHGRRRGMAVGHTGKEDEHHGPGSPHPAKPPDSAGQPSIYDGPSPRGKLQPQSQTRGGRRRPLASLET